MKLLLDTQLLLWAAGMPKSLPPAARRELEDRNNILLFSAASLWEVAITGEHALFTDSLPALHKDPFDRILVAQASVEGVTLLTADSQVARYPGPIRKV